MSRDPTRLSESTDLPGSPAASPDAAFLSAVLRAQRGARASDEKMQELSARLGPLLQTPSASPARGVPWLGISVVVAIGLAASGVWISRATGSRPEATNAPIAVAPSAPEQLAPVPTFVASPPAISVDALPSVRVVASSPVASRCDEIELIDRADTKLRAGDASAALSVVREHEQRCASGALVQERERIAIEALAKLGRVDAARARASSFEARFPASPHLRRVRQVVERLETPSR
jgi:hypothetical protein